jgi:hypothetical protein
VLDLRGVAVLVLLMAVVASGSAVDIRAVDVEIVASSAVEGAEKTVIEAYEAVWAAEAAGADVLELLERLDTAGEYLALARMCLRTGHVADAMGNASLSVGAVEGLVEDAEVLGAEAAQQAVEHRWIVLGGSMGGVVAVVCGGWVGWTWFTRWYHRRVLMMKPEVVDDAS